LIDITVAVTTPEDLPLLRLQVANRMLIGDSLKRVSSDNGMTVWQATAQAIALEKGENRIEVFAWNRDGQSRSSTVVPVRFDPLPPPKAVVEIVDPTSDAVVQTAVYPVRVRITSKSVLKRFELLRGGQTVQLLDEIQLEPNSDGSFVLEKTVPVQLERKLNALRVRVINDGGEQTAAASVSYVPPPVRVVLDRLEAKSRPGTALPPEMKNGSITEEMPEAQIVMQGRVIWPDQFDSRLRETKWLHVRVNGFQQLPAELEAQSDGLERGFQVELWLHRAKDNSIELELPGIAHEAGSRLAFRMNCRKPQRLPTLHLFIVGIGENDESELRNRALRAVQAQSVKDDHFSTPAFTSGQIYMLAKPWVSHGQIIGQLERIRRSIIDRKSRSDVVIIYYQGRESIDSSGRFLFHTSDRPIGSDYMERLFANVPGAQILFLDVTREPHEPPGRIAWPAHIGVLRYVWQSEGATPIEARLIASLADATAIAARLVDIESFVSGRYRQLRETYFDALKYEPYLPESLGELTIGAGLAGNSP
jgi:hypothetical protein